MLHVMVTKVNWLLQSYVPYRIIVVTQARCATCSLTNNGARRKKLLAAVGKRFNIERDVAAPQQSTCDKQDDNSS